MIRILIIFLLPGFSLHHLYGQSSFEIALQHMGMELSIPTDISFQTRTPIANPFVNYDYEWASREAGMEIRIALYPCDSNSFTTVFPNLEAARAAASAATNSEEASMTVLHLSPGLLRETFGASWGREWYFQPKREFSQRSTCRMVSIYQKGRGLALIFFLFDKKTTYLEHYYGMLKFQNPPNQ